MKGRIIPEIVVVATGKKNAFDTSRDCSCSSIFALRAPLKQWPADSINLLVAFCRWGQRVESADHGVHIFTPAVFMARVVTYHAREGKTDHKKW